MTDKTKAFFLDLDGTFLTDAKEIPDINRNAMEELLQRGHKAVITTGRPLPSAIKQARKLGLTGEGCFLIAYNGGVLYDMHEETIIFEKTIPLPIVSDIFTEVNRRGIHIQAYDREAVLVEPRCDNEIVRFYCGRIEMPFRVIDSCDQLVEEPAKLLLIDRTGKESLEGMRAWISEHFGDQLDTFYSSAEFLEIMTRGLNKGQGLRQMAEILQINIADTVAVGDEENDISMIQAAGVGCAMANAVPAVKEAADYITEADNNHGGAAEVIRRFILNQ